MPSSLGRPLNTLPTLHVALLSSPFAFVCEPLPLISGELPRVGQPLALVCQPLALVSDAVTPRAGSLSSLCCGGLPADLCSLSALGVLPPLAPRFGAFATLDLAPFRGPLAPVRQPLTLVGCEFPDVRQPLALVGDPLPLIRYALALVCQPLAPFHRRLTLAPTLDSPLERLGQLVGQALTLRGKLLPLLGDVLALRGDPLAFPSHPNELARLVRRLLRLDRVRGRFCWWISVRVHRDRTSFD